MVLQYVEMDVETIRDTQAVRNSQLNRAWAFTQGEMDRRRKLGNMLKT
jgi:hypothetical protein